MRLPATGAENRARTDTKSPSRDFKSLASANSAIPAFLCIFSVLLLRVCSEQAPGTSRSASANSAIPACRFCLRLRNDKGGIRRIPPLFLEAPSRLELENEGFADLCLTTWLWCHSLFICTRASECCPRRMKSVNAVRVFFGAGDGIAASLFPHRPLPLFLRALWVGLRGGCYAPRTRVLIPTACRPRRMKSVNAVRVFFGAGDGIRTRDFHLGKVTLYH